MSQFSHSYSLPDLPVMPGIIGYDLPVHPSMLFQRGYDLPAPRRARGGPATAMADDGEGTALDAATASLHAMNDDGPSDLPAQARAEPAPTPAAHDALPPLPEGYSHAPASSAPTHHGGKHGELPPLPEGFTFTPPAAAPPLGKDGHPVLPEGFKVLDAPPPGYVPEGEHSEHETWGDWLVRNGVAASRGLRESIPFAKDVSAFSRAHFGNPLTGEAPSGDFAHEKHVVEDQQKRAMKDAPAATIAGEIGGMLLPGGVASRALKAENAIANALPLPFKSLRNIGAGAVTGAGMGAVQGLGEGVDMDERLHNAATMGGLGAVGGAALPLVGTALGMGARTAAEEAATRLGVRMPRILGSESDKPARLAAHLSSIPVIGGPIRAAVHRAVDETGKVLENVPGLDASVGRIDAGERAKAVLQDWVEGRSDRTVQKAYDAVTNHIDPAIKTELTSTRAAVSDIGDSLRDAGMDENSPAIKMVLEAATNPNGLSYKGIQTLRSRVGEQLKSSILPGGSSQSELKQLYSALSDDLRNAAQNAGGQQGLAAFNRANALYKQVSDKRAELARVIGKDADRSPEAVFNNILGMALDKTGNANRLAMVRKSMSPDQWGDVTSGVVNHMGRDAEGKFSPARFIAEYGKMSDRGRDVLFGPVGNPVRNAVEDVRAVSGAMKTANRHSNWSGTAHHLLGAGALYGAYNNPEEAAEGLAAGLPLAWFLSRPKSAILLSRYLKNPTSAAHLALLQSAQSGLADIGGTPAIRDNFFPPKPAATDQSTQPAPVAQERPHRAAGGSLRASTDREQERGYPAKRATRMERAVARAQAVLAAETQPLMSAPDEHVAAALRAAHG